MFGYAGSGGPAEMADFDSEVDVEQNQDKKLILKYWLESKSGPLKFKPAFTVEELDLEGKAASGFKPVQAAQMRDGGGDAKAGFSWQLDENTVKIVVRAFDGSAQVFEDAEDLNVNVALNKGKTVFTVKPAAPAPPAVPPFVYTPIPHGIRNMWIAKEWKISSTTGLTGTQANNVVNQTYEHLNNQLLDYMGGPPYVANWFTFGKWASREAGQGIKNLAAGASAMNDLIPTTLEAVDILAPIPTGGIAAYLASHVIQFSVLAQVMADDSGGMFIQVIHLFFTTIGMPVPTPADVKDPKWEAKFVVQLLKHKGAVGEIFDKMTVLLKVLVHGNQGIYRNMAWSTEVFCQGESGGASQGLQKLEEWCAVASPDDPHDLSPRDPQRFLRDSFKMYKDCRDLWVQSLGERDPTKKQALLDKRRTLAHVANVTIGCQEQMLILQGPDVFSQPTAQEIVAGQEGAMRLHDPGTTGSKRTIHLLPSGNWADFPQRMGVVPGSGPVQVTVANPYPVPAGAKFTAPSSPTNYIPRSDITTSSSTGTIYEYFFQNVDDNAGGSVKTPLMTVSMSSAEWDNVDLYPTASRGSI